MTSLLVPATPQRERPETDDAADRGPSSTAAPRPRRLGKVLGWVFVAALLLGVSLLSLRFVATQPDLTGALHPDSVAPAGGKALAELTRQQGVEVSVTGSRAEAAAGVDDDTTLVLTDPFTLTDAAAEGLVGSADRVVLLTSSSRMLRLLDLGDPADPGGGRVEAGCTVSEFARVGTIEADRLFRPDAGVDGCFRDGSGDAAVLRAERDGRLVTLVEGSRLFSNAALAEDGNAALGLALLAQTDRVIWYVPSFQDSDITGQQEDTLGSLTPEWVTPAILLLMLAGIAAACWRGRRFGPLVAESLPVTVRASETMQGRARLTAKAADAAHAGAAIREGTVSRLSRRLGLSVRAGVREVADAASDRLRVPRGSLYELLGGPPPATDRDLVDLARKLAELEAAVENAVHIERNVP
ncbi:DUF4350 domain-containing protein [Microbacterium sp.]|uniref:DUF4350 domain-containing protein n=1 Tax=Microbacterium sp. TaxID=51671 RepID=UPI0028119F53|nr:DUF4350 domain-containing protein [Microbacterium sp.]